MGILVGMDEAGYGPNLGPLVVAASVWEVAEETREEIKDGEQRTADDGYGSPNSGPETGDDVNSAVHIPQSSTIDVDLYSRLRGSIAKTMSDRRIAIADSKKLHQPGKGLRRLEHGLHTVLAAIGQPATCWSALVESCNADPDDHHAHLCWHTGFDCPLPLDVPAEEIAQLAARLRDDCATVGVRPIAIRARFVFPAQFNDLSEKYNGKGAALSHVTISLLRELMDALPIESNPTAKETSQPSPQPPAPSPQPPIFVVCDKHSGRNYYAGLLQHFFPERSIAIVSEGNDESRYEWEGESSRVSVAFRAKGETFLPTALASMTAKYLRELSMRAFNEFWCARIPNLRPTAGYPADAHRYREAIAPLQRELKIDDHTLWRKR